MSNVIQLSEYRRPAVSAECQRKAEIAMAIEMLQRRQHFFERRARSAQVPVSDFRRGWMCAAAIIEHAKLAEMIEHCRSVEMIEAAFQSIIKEAMQRRATGGKYSRTPWTPTSDGFLHSIARYVATGKVYRWPKIS